MKNLKEKMRFKLFLILNTVGGIGFISGCVSLSEVWPTKEEIKPLRTVNFYTGATSGFVGTPAAISKDTKAGSETAKDWYKRFCANGKPIRKYGYKVKVIIPSSQVGMVTTEAARERSQWDKSANKVVLDLFISGRRKPEMRRPYSGETQNTKVLAVTSQAEAAFIKDYEGNEYRDRNSVVRDYAQAWMFLKPSKSDDIYLVPRFAMFLTNPQGVNLSGNKVSLIQVPNSRGSRISPIYLAQNEFTVRTSTGLVNLSPLSLAYLDDLYQMAENFVLLVPTKEQETFGISRYDPTNLKQVVMDRAKIFDDVIRRFTTVKSEQSDDPNIINYQLDFDYGLFCAYGRPLKDFLSK